MAFTIKEINNRNKNIKVIKGDTFTRRIDKYTEDLLRYVPADEDQIIFEVFNKYTDEESIFEREIPHEDMTLVITAEETDAMKYGNYVYTIKIVYPDGFVDTFVNGDFSIVTADKVS